jgi:hypothetical protein
MLRTTKRLVVVIATGLLLVTTGTSAHAILDQTPPTLSVPVRPAFVVGSVVDDYELEGFTFAENIAQRIEWSATDDVGVCSYDLHAVPAGAPPEAILSFSQETSYTFSAGDYDDDFGGGSSHIDGFLVTARDCTGNATTRVMTDRTLLVIQETGTSATTYGWTQAIDYTGNWQPTACACFLADGTLRSDAGARASFTRTYEDGDQVAFVMAQGPGRGRAGIRVDGRWLATVDTIAAVNTNRVVTFHMSMSAGTHTVTIVNQGTPGRPRIDLDAILINTGNPFGEAPLPDEVARWSGSVSRPTVDRG